jgi:NAD(P)-dependent dehydrogenase (short-subunit alcohol dehydrogenase family)
VNPLLIGPAAALRRHVMAPVAAAAGRPLSSPVAGRVVVVTGASSGVGEATAKLVASRGATVVLIARRADELARVAEEIRSARGQASAFTCDLTDGDAVDATVGKILADLGHVDMLVNNAGRSIRRSLDLSYDRMHDFERTMAINYFGPVRLTLALLPSMREQKFGHVVNVVTWGVQLKAPKFAAYIASKTALDTFARIAGREAWYDGVTFSNVRLSLVRTDMITATEAYRRAKAKTPEEAAAIVLRALEDRPLTLGTMVSNAGEVLGLVAPRLSDALMAEMNRRMPDSRAAQGIAPPDED